MQPVVSVVTPVYRAVQWLPQYLESMAAQTLATEDFELVLVLNGPDDGSRDLVDMYSAANPDLRIVMVTSSGSTAAAARNDGLDAASGAYVTFVDADDWVSVDYLASLARHASPDRLATARIVDVGPDGSQESRTALNVALGRAKSRLVDPRDAPQALGLNACKLFPRAWFETVRFVPELISGEDIVLVCQLLSSFPRSGVVLDRGPFLEEATYFRRLTEDSVSRRERSYDFSVTQRLAVVSHLTRVSADPLADQIPLVRRYIGAQLTFVAEFIAAHPEHAEAVARDIAALGLPDVGYRDVLARGRFSLRNRAVALPHPPGGALLTALDAASLNERVDVIDALRSAGIRVRVQYFSGALSRKLKVDGEHKLVTFQSSRHDGRPGSRSGGGRRTTTTYLTTRAAMEIRQTAGQARQALRRRSPNRAGVIRRIAEHDRAARGRARRAGVVIGVDEGGSRILEAMALGRPENRFAAQARGNLDRYLMLVAATRYPPDAQFARSTADAALRLSAGDEDRHDALDPEAWSLVAWNLFRAHHYRQVLRVLDAAAVVHPQHAVSAGFDVWRRAAEVNLDERALEFSEEVLTAALGAADEALLRHDLENALFLLEGACEVAFAAPSNVSHVDALLYRDPERVLAPLQSARVWQLATGSPPPDSRCAPAPTDSRARVVVSPGPFRSFAAPVIAALERAGASVRVHDLPQLAPRFRWLGIDPTALREVFEQSLGLGHGPSPTLIDPFRAADVIWCDWADQSAVLASRLAPADCRIVVRVHGADATSLWLHLVDWERVSDVIFVSEHLRSMVCRQLGGRLDSTQQHVVPNLVELDRFTTTKDPSADRTLGMVGWAQVVKDPLWTIEVLALLRSVDPAWRLVLFGSDFADFERADERRYATRFRRRVLDDDVRDAITFEGYVPDLPDRLGGVGYALSSSLRESQGVGLVEMVASGAVPVVRDWPMYRDDGGARSLFPAEWVVESPDEAVSRILATSTERDRVARECRQHVLSTNDPDRIAEQYCAIILGD